MTGGSRPSPRVYTIPSAAAFLPSLARAVLEEGFPARGRTQPSVTELARWTILLPTRRTVRELSRAFMAATGFDAAILPRIRPIGEVDEDEDVFAGADSADPRLPPAISPTVRHFILARLIADWAAANPRTGLARALSGFAGQVFALARSLGELVDAFETEEISLDEIEKLMGAEFAEHRLAMLDFLTIVRKRLPEEMSERGLMGHAARRSLLLRREAARLETFGADGPIIAAGSTGSIRATANLLRVVARLKEGAVVLPGLDLHMDAASWAAVDDEPGHPQFGLKRLLSVLGVERKSVEVFPGMPLDSAAEARQWLAGEIMRPPQTTGAWRESLSRKSGAIRSAMAAVELIEAADQREESRVIATIMRNGLETPGLTLGVVTPSRRLARRIRAELKRWAIEIDDVGGEDCAGTPAGTLFRLLLDLGLSRFGAREFAQILKHPLLALDAVRDTLADVAGKVEIALLRGAIEPLGLSGLKTLLVERRDAARGGKAPERIHPAVRRLSEADWRDMSRFLDRFSDITAFFLDLMAENRPLPLRQYLLAHLECAEALTRGGDGHSLLWRGEEGEALSELFSALLEHADEAPRLTPADYGALIAGELAARRIRKPQHDHPRLAVMSLLEARLLNCDVMILSGLNHGVWPAEAEIDPWLSRPMRAEVKLASPDSLIGLSAHDFVQHFAASRVYLTCSRKIDGVPVVPSRWITRLEAVLNAAAIDLSRERPSSWLGWATALDHGQRRPGATQPRPLPPLAARPASLSVTRVEKLISNPYFLYAEKVLGLEPLDSLGKRLDAADRGSLVHNALRSFTESYRGGIGADAVDRLLDCGRQIFTPHFHDPQVQAFWWPQFERIARWFIDEEREWRSHARQQHCECEARATIDVDGRPFTLTARADRIDELSDGTLRIIDYKTGALPPFTAVDEGSAPQLPLEAWLAAQGAFSGCKACKVSELMYVRLTGGQIAGEIRLAGRNTPSTLAAAVHAGLLRLLQDYASASTPYVALDTDEGLSAPGGAHHLARTREWLFNLDEEADS